MVAHVRRVESLLSATGLWDTGFQFGDWLDPTAPPTIRPPPRRTTASWPPPASTATCRLRRRDRRAARTQRRRRRTSQSSPSAPGRLQRALRRRRRHDPQRRRTVYALAIVFGLLDEDDNSSSPVTGSRNSSPTNGYRIQTGFAGTPYHRRCADRDRPPRRRLPAAAAAGVPVLAVSGHHGRDDDLGAMGLHAARRHHQPRPDDELQPLRTRRRGRLDAPQHRRHRAAGSPATPGC